MTVEEKVGQLFSTHVYGNTVDSYDAANIAEFGLGTPREIIEKYHLGGVLYFAWTHSVDNPEQAAGLSNGIQEVSTSTGAKVPQLISIDQEGGLVARVLEPATQTPGNMALGATRDVQGTRDLAAIQGTELAAMGISQNFAPVADVNVNPANPVIGVRSFGSDPGLVADMTAAQVLGYEDGRRHLLDREALPRARRHGGRQPLRVPDHHAHARGVGDDRQAAVPGSGRRRDRRHHDGAHPGAGARPVG